MKAIPIEPGQLYRVSGSGIKANICATGGCQAIAIAISMLEATQC